MKNRLAQNLMCLIVFAVAGGILYSRTLNGPWLMDDTQNILNNPGIRDLWGALRNLWTSRGVAFFSFAVNYHFSGLSLPGFHIANIAIHVLTTWTVFLIMRRMFTESFWLPFGGACVFLAHPLQTQAVNYIVQRMASMCGLFFFLSIYFYMWARQRRNEEAPMLTDPLLYGLSLISCMLALYTKQNAVLLPLALLLVDRYFIATAQGGWKRLLLLLLPFVVLAVFASWHQVGKHTVLLKDAGNAQFWTKAKATSAVSNIAPEKVKLAKPPKNIQAIYFATELSVLWLYLRLLFFPVNQVFDYGYPLVGSFFELQVGVALLGHLVLAGVAIWLRRRRPLISFGIAWFYLTLSIESTIIPLDAVVEHRLYMTMAGFALVLIDLVRMIPWRKAAAPVFSCAVIVFLVLTWQRNEVWGDPVLFGQDNVRKAPYNQRAYLTLANAYADRGRWVEAEKTLKAAILLRPDFPVPYENLGSALVRQGRLLEAVPWYEMALNLAPGDHNILYNAGIVLVRIGDIPAAKAVVERLKPVNAELGGRLEMAVNGGGR